MKPPPSITTSVPGTFAHDTLKRRVPQILDDTRRKNEPLAPPVARAFDELRAELVGGVLRGLREAAPDRAAWDAACAPAVGRSWLDLPWYFAEAFFYRRLLEAWGFFADGANAGVDPFAPDKRAEWRPGAAPAHAARALRALPADVVQRVQRALRASLWGNRTDLSYNVAAALGKTGGGTDDDEALLLVDDSAPVVELLARRPKLVVIIADNAGTELLMDLVLIDALLALGVGRVVMHVKAHPFLVSDTIGRDVIDGLAALRAAGDDGAALLAARIGEHQRASALTVTTDPYWTSSGFFDALPAPLSESLAAADLVVVKGDANYRRLLRDAQWPHDTPFADVVRAFPAPLVALRTLKAEVMVGLPAGRSEVLSRDDPAWLINGRRGVIQARL